VSLFYNIYKVLLRNYFSFHIEGWRLNNLGFDDVDRGIESIRGIVEKIKSLPTDREIIERIEKKIFGVDVDSIVESIHDVNIV
jgi:hypothetical protein